MAIIDFGGSTGSTEAGRFIRAHIKKLIESFNSFNCLNVHFPDFDKFHIIFLVSGKNKDYGSEGPEGLKKLRGKNVLVIYFAIPERRWKESIGTEYISAAVRQCLYLLSAKAMNVSTAPTLDAFTKDISKCITIFESQ